MKVVHSAPVALVEHVGEGRSMHVAYSEKVLSSATYRQFYADKLQDREYVILNSIEQRGPAGMEDFIEAAVALQPSEVVLPNIPGSPVKSDRLTAEASGVLQSAGLTRVPFMAVPLGEDFHDYLEGVKRLSTLSQVQVIGVTSDVFDKYHLTRRQFVYAMRKVCPRTLHLLGMTDDLADLKDPLIQSTIRSCETAKAVVWGLGGVEVSLNAKRVPAYSGKDLYGGAAGYMTTTTEDAVKLAAIKANVAEFDKRV